MLSIIKSIFCEDCDLIDVINRQKNCEESACECELINQNESILNIYAHFYFMFDSNNLNNYLSRISITEYSEYSKMAYQQIKERIDMNFPIINDLNTLNYKDISFDFILAIINDLEKSLSSSELLIRSFNWFIIIGEKLQSLREKLKTENVFFIETSRGRLIIKQDSLIKEYIQNKVLSEGIRKFQDLGDTDIRKFAQYFILVKPSKHFKINYLNSNIGADYNVQNLGDFNVSYISGSILVNEYLWEIDENLDPRPFVIKGIQKEGHSDYVMESVKTALFNSDLIILPELFIEYEEQIKLIDKFDEIKMEQLFSPEGQKNTIMLSGSFHRMIKDDLIYNTSQIAFTDSKNIEVYKKNRYKIMKNSVYKNIKIMSKFERVDGIEGIQTDYNFIDIIDCPLGRIAVLICVDFLKDEVVKELIQYNVDFVIVMSLTENPLALKFHNKLSYLGETLNAVIFICNNTGINPESYRFVCYFPFVDGIYVSKEEKMTLTLDDLMEEAQKQKNKYSLKTQNDW